MKPQDGPVIVQPAPDWENAVFSATCTKCECVFHYAERHVGKSNMVPCPSCAHPSVHMRGRRVASAIPLPRPVSP